MRGERARSVIATAALVGFATTTLVVIVLLVRLHGALDRRMSISEHVACVEDRWTEYQARAWRYLDALANGARPGEPGLETLRADALAAHFRVLRANNTNVKDRCPLLPE